MLKKTPKSLMDNGAYYPLFENVFVNKNKNVPLMLPKDHMFWGIYGARKLNTDRLSYKYIILKCKVPVQLSPSH